MGMPPGSVALGVLYALLHCLALPHVPSASAASRKRSLLQHVVASLTSGPPFSLPVAKEQAVLVQ